MFCKRSHLLSVLLLLFIMVVTGCTNGNNDKGVSGSKENTNGNINADQVEEGKEITLDFWVGGGTRGIEGYDNPDSGDWEKIKAEEFMDLHPNVNINVEIIPLPDMEQKLNVAITGDSTPDVIYDNIPNRMMRHAKNGELEPLEDVISEEKDDWKEDYLAMGSYDGTVFGLPIMSAPSMMFINKTIFKDKGLEDLIPEDRSWTWSEWEHVLEKVSDDRIYGTAFHALNEQADQLTVSHLLGAGSEWLNEEQTEYLINSKEGIEALSFLVDMVEKGYAPSPASMAPGDALELFMQGRLATLKYVPIYNRVEDAIEEGGADPSIELYGIAPPTKEGVTPKLTVTLENGYALFKQEDNYKKEMGIEFIKFLVESKNVELISKANLATPARVSAIYEIDNPEITEAMDKLGEYPVLDIGKSLDGYGDTRHAFYPELQAVFLGEKTPEEGLNDFVENANEIINE